MKEKFSRKLSRPFAFVLAFCLAFSGLTACGGTGTDSSANKSSTEKAEAKTIKDKNSDASETDASKSTGSDKTSADELSTTVSRISDDADSLKGGSGDSLTTTIVSTNSWTQGTDTFYQYDIEVTNNSDSQIKSWYLDIPLDQKPQVNSAWCCKWEIRSDNTLHIYNEDYNGTVDAGNKVTGIGAIIQFSKEEKKLEGTYISAVTDGMKDGTDNGSSGSSKASRTGDASSDPGSKGGSDAGNASSDAGSSDTDSDDANMENVDPDSYSKTSYYGKHGRLHVEGRNLVDKNGKKIVLKGVSTHGIGWFPQYVNYRSFKTLKKKYKVNVVRLAMYSAEGAGYATGGNKTELLETIDRGVKAATKLGMYVIIDWHVLQDQTPLKYQGDALKFFKKVSKKYKKYGNVLYEICNEPNGSASWSDIKQYSKKVIPAIRKNSPKSVIIVGTPTWSQEVDKPDQDPLKYKNVMYTLHFYAATHKDDLRNRMETALKHGTPIFITEFSICDASGNGGIDYGSAAAWKKLIRKYGISYCAWSLCNKAESASLIKSSCTKTSGWKKSDLSDTGKWLKKMLAGK